MENDSVNTGVSVSHTTSNLTSHPSTVALYKRVNLLTNSGSGHHVEDMDLWSDFPSKNQVQLDFYLVSRVN
jgi:hypothetical protein